MGRRPAMEKYKTGAGARGGLFQRRRGSVLEELDGVHLAFKRPASNQDAEGRFGGSGWCLLLGGRRAEKGRRAELPPMRNSGAAWAYTS
jgi:hypothetical protein